MLWEDQREDGETSNKTIEKKKYGKIHWQPYQT